MPVSYTSQASPTSDSDTAPASREARTRSKRPGAAPRRPRVPDKLEIEAERLAKEFKKAQMALEPDPEDGWASPPEEYHALFGRSRGAPASETTQGLQERREDRGAEGSTPIENPTQEERLDWYLDAALTEIKGLKQLADRDKLKLVDLWELLTFGQHMYAGIKQEHGIDLNEALMKRERENMAKGLRPTPLHSLFSDTWPKPPPERCPTCSRAVAGEVGSVRTSFTRLYPHVYDRLDDERPQGGWRGYGPGKGPTFSPTVPTIPPPGYLNNLPRYGGFFCD